MLIVSEPGSDAESVAKALHARGRAAAGAAFVALDCKRDGIDRLLFGQPAARRASDLEEIGRDGSLAGARRGTLFLQDVGELPASVQARLARIVRDGEASVGGAPVEMSCRLIASATTAIDADAQARRFRADLFRRLSSSRIDLPPLRERGEDLPELATSILEELSEVRQLGPRTFTQAALALLSALPWPGNLAELHDVIERVVRDSSGEVVQIEQLLPALQLARTPAPFVPAGSLREARLRFERHYITAVLHQHGWRLADAAQALGIKRPNLYRKARQLGLALTRVAE